MHTQHTDDFSDEGELLPVDLAMADDNGGLGDPPPLGFDEVTSELPEDLADLSPDDLDESLLDDSTDAEPDLDEARLPSGFSDLFKPSNMKHLQGDPNSVYSKLVEYGILRKLTDIVLAKVSIPWHLRKDAAQEVHATWASLKAKSHYVRNQLGCYAYYSGKHAALKLRRTIGAAVVIPGALFRTGRNTAFMEAIGAAVNPKDVDDYRDSIELSVEAKEYLMPPQEVTAEYFRTRISGLPLSKSQRAVAERVLVKRMSADSIATELGVRVSYVERLILQVTQMLNAKDDEAVGRSH